MSRYGWTLLTLASIGTLGAVAYYFYAEYRHAVERERIVVDLKNLAVEAGPCAALLQATALGTEIDYDILQNAEHLRNSFAAQILGGGDRRGVKVLLAATRDGLISDMLCEQIKIVADGGEVHPVMALLRFTREEDPCEEALALDTVIAGLGSHRGLLLRGLMEDVSRLKCLSPRMSREVAIQVASMLHDDPQAFDDLEVLPIGSYLSRWAPLYAAQVGCRIDAFGDISRLGRILGCTPDQQSRVLIRYRYAHPIPATATAPEMPAGSTVLLIWKRNNRCEIRPVEGVPRVLTVACDALALDSSVDVAILADRIELGQARADLIAGLAFAPATGDAILASREDPGVRSWFVYTRTGLPLGKTHVVSMAEMVARAGEELPESPLRAFCRANGAKFCYDVDWTQLVSPLPGDAAVFLSRPLSLFVREVLSPPDLIARLVGEAYGRDSLPGAVVRYFTVDGGAQILVESRPGSVEMRWRQTSEQPWHGQAFGSGEGGGVPPAARLIAVLDLLADGRPDLVVQRAERQEVAGEVRDLLDEVLLLGLTPDGNRFVPLTRLTVREY